MYTDLRSKSKKAGLPPGTPVYTGKYQNVTSSITTLSFSTQEVKETQGTDIKACLSPTTDLTTWVQVTGLNNAELIEQIAQTYQLHPLTVEDILNVEQRCKVEEFDNYFFITLKLLAWDSTLHTVSVEQLSLVFGSNFVLSFQEHETRLFDNIRTRLHGNPTQRLRQHGSDYLVYRLMDAVIDQYFVVLETISDQIESIEERIIVNPSTKNSRVLYRLKRQVLMLRKAIWPMREAISRLLQIDSAVITPFTHLYLRDVYDHTVQAVDTVETFRDMLSSILDMYLSSLTNRMNEIMKVLTIIATIFIPVTFIASIYGMNFVNMPELHWRFGYPATLIVMLVIIITMLVYFKKNRWL
ncbi:MAG TPA: magnesium/cobalt transporter CorA [Gammaproteobacteria bacterium]|nr:magnesium/cobalt transporter CorA [Gammaproteobacteria bacterium]